MFFKYLFFIIVDDGGFDYAIEGEKESKLSMETYHNILKLAMEYDMRIPICFTMKYFDKENISSLGKHLGYVDELVRFLKNNRKYIEIGYHGLTHEYDDHAGEFFCLDTGNRVSEKIQRDHIEKSKQIFDYWGLKFPEIFVPPYHAWEEGVTDKILSEYGVKYLISYRNIRYSGYRYKWEGSRYLEFLPRRSLGLNGADYDVHPDMIRKIKLFPEKKLVDFVTCHIIPQRFLTRIRIAKSFFNKPVHSYMTHIGNFSGQPMDFWYKIFDFVINRKDLRLCKSNEEAVCLYKELTAKS